MNNHGAFRHHALVYSLHVRRMLCPLQQSHTILMKLDAQFHVKVFFNRYRDATPNLCLKGERTVGDVVA